MKDDGNDDRALLSDNNSHNNNNNKRDDLRERLVATLIPLNAYLENNHGVGNIIIINLNENISCLRQILSLLNNKNNNKNNNKLSSSSSSEANDNDDDSTSSPKNIVSLENPDMWRELAQALEGVVEELAYAWEEDIIVSSSTATATTRTTTTADDDNASSSPHHHYYLLTAISLMYREAAFLTMATSDDEDGVADSFLDWAIASKRANRLQDCAQAHFRRMALLPNLKRLDAVRLLGLNSSALDKTSSQNDTVMVVEEICKTGIFELVTEQQKPWADEGNNTNDVDDYGCYPVYYPSPSAIQLGMKVRQILVQAGYTLENCQQLLLDVVVVSSTEEEEEEREKRNRLQQDGLFFSADTFFRHRRDMLQKEEDDGKEEVSFFHVLACLFLFGLAMPRDQLLRGAAAADDDGDDDLDTLLLNARLVRPHPLDANLLIPEVQIYPLPVDAFDDINTTKDKQQQQQQQSSSLSSMLFFMTDWNLESMRLPRDAIMAVGYDTLELLSLSSGLTSVFDSRQKQEKQRVLDLCCGCGIQGLFAAGRATSMAPEQQAAKKDGDDSRKNELYCMDINPRACHFTTGNMCLNGLVSKERGGGGGGALCQEMDICSVRADLYSPLPLLSSSSSSEPDSASSPSSTPTPSPVVKDIIGTFDCILSNPPFVAVPAANSVPTMSPALYSAGGGIDGMGLLRRMLKDLMEVLSSDTDDEGGSGSGAASRLLMVTELPNIEDSCSLLENFLELKRRKDEVEGSTSRASVRVAYVKEDVELVQDYAEEREVEAGCCVQGRDWNSSSSGGRSATPIVNRALALISISRVGVGETTKQGPSASSSAGKISHQPATAAAFEGEASLMELRQRICCSSSATTTTAGDDDHASDELLSLLEEQDAFLTKEGIAFARSVLL